MMSENEQENEKRETLADNAAARDEVVLRLSKEEYKGMQEALSEHDRLCEMLSESRKSVGNVAAMREALECVREKLYTLDCYGEFERGVYELACEAIDRALAAPPRQCDVGTAEEQEERYLKLKREHVDRMARCPAVGQSFFFPDSLYWAQMPYEEGGAK